MRVTNQCQLAVSPSRLFHVSSRLLALRYAFQGSAGVIAHDTDLEQLWTTAVRTDAIDAVVHDELCWVLDRTGLSAYQPATGERVNRIEFPVSPKMQAGGVTAVSDGFVVAIEHGDDHPPAPPRMLRIDTDGRVRWITELPMEDVFLQTQQINVGDGSKTGRVVKHHVRSWRCSYYIGGRVVASADTALGHFCDMPQSGMGMVYIVRLEDGALRSWSPMAPIHHVTATSSGDFLIGVHGYGAFETWRCWPDVGVVDKWNSSGTYVDDRGDIRVLEMSNTGQPQHVARLLAGGEVTRGSLLPRCCDPRSVPHLMDDGSLLFYREDGLYVVRDLTVVDHVSLVEGKRNQQATNLEVVSECAFIGVTTWVGDDRREECSLFRVEL